MNTSIYDFPTSISRHAETLVSCIHMILIFMPVYPGIQRHLYHVYIMILIPVYPDIQRHLYVDPLVTHVPPFLQTGLSESSTANSQIVRLSAQFGPKTINS